MGKETEPKSTRKASIEENVKSPNVSFGLRVNPQEGKQEIELIYLKGKTWVARAWVS